MKRAFTLVELLAVIVLLGVIAGITVPIVNGIIRDSKEDALKMTIENIERAADSYSTRHELDDSGKTMAISLNDLKNAGNLKDTELINPVTKNALPGCVLYRWNEDIKQYQFTYDDTCSTTDLDVALANVNGVFNEEGWAKEDFFVSINTTGTTYKWCISDKKCNPTVEVNAQSGYVTASLETATLHVCAQAVHGNITSEVVCSDTYKLDKTAPIPGKAELNAPRGKDGWYVSDGDIVAIMGTDSLSGHADTVVSVSGPAGNIVATVTTTDKAGNTSSANYTLKVDTTNPIATITKSVSDNKNVFTANVTPSTTVSGYTYKWYKDNVEITGQTASTLSTAEVGTYKVKVTTGAGKEATSNEITVHSYTITYNVNGGTGTIANMTKIEDIPLTLTNVVPTRSNYEFKGWSTTASGSVEYAASGTYTANSDVTLYAVWQASWYCSAGTLTQSGSSYICVANNPTSSTSSTQTGCGSTNRGSACSTYNSESACERYACQFNSSSCRDYSCNCHEYGGKWENCYDFYDVIYSYTTTYSCPSGWSYYSGSGSSMQCYRAATQG